MPSMPPIAAPTDADARRAARPVVCYPVETLPAADLALYGAARERLVTENEVIVPPRDGALLPRAGRLLLPHPL